MSNEKTALEKALEDFKRSVEITRDVRFQANLRLSKRQRWSAYMVSLLSLYVISLSLLPNIIEVNEIQSQILLSCSVILSVFIIFTSLIDGAQNFYHQGELLHQCARKVASVYHDLKNIDPTADSTAAWQELKRLQGVYRMALDECPINHENMDFIKEQAYKPNLFPNNYPKKFRYPKILWNKIYYIIAAHSWMLPHVAALLVMSAVIYVFILKG